MRILKLSHPPSGVLGAPLLSEQLGATGPISILTEYKSAWLSMSKYVAPLPVDDLENAITCNLQLVLLLRTIYIPV